MPDLIIDALSASVMKGDWMSKASLAILLLRNSLSEFKNCWQFLKDCFRKLKSLGIGTCRGLLLKSVLAVMLVSFLESNFRKSPRPSLPLKRAPPLTPTLSPSGEREETALRSAVFAPPVPPLGEGPYPIPKP